MFLAHSGTPLFFSADFEALDQEKMDILKETMKINVETDTENMRPLDWLYRNYP